MTAQDSAARRYSVQLGTRSKSQSKLFVVSLSEKHCSCLQWNQTGIPCVHAEATFQFLGTDKSAGFYTTEYFHAVMLTASRVGLYTEDRLRQGRFPSDADIIGRSAKESFQELTAVTKEAPTEMVTSKRISSTGDSSSRGAITLARMARSVKRPCIYCGKLFARRHSVYACAKYREKSGFQPELATVKDVEMEVEIADAENDSDSDSDSEGEGEDA